MAKRLQFSARQKRILRAVSDGDTTTPAVAVCQIAHMADIKLVGSGANIEMETIQ